MLYSKESDMLTSKITACLVIHDEEQVLARCLDSVVKVTNNILVVHDGPCSDASLQICAKYGCTVFTRDFIGEAEPHRVWLFEKVKTEYCLQIDADEFLSTDLLRALPALIQDHVSAYTAIWPYWDGTRYTTRHWPRKLFLYRIEDIDFLGAPHEAVRVNGSIMHLPHQLEHRPGYDNLSLHTFRSKWQKWAKIHSSYYLKSHDDIKQFPKSGKRLYPHYYRWMVYAPISAVPLGVYHTLACLLSGGITQGFIGVKSCFFMGLYYCVVSLYVAWGKYGKNS